MPSAISATPSDRSSSASALAVTLAKVKTSAIEAGSTSFEGSTGSGEVTGGESGANTGAWSGFRRFRGLLPFKVRVQCSTSLHVIRVMYRILSFNFG